MRKSGYREIFVFIAGATPQVLTETLYALAVRKPAIYPDEIYVITTSAGRNMVEKTLLEGGVIKTFVKEYNLPSLSLNEKSFIIPVDSSGMPLSDIRSASDNELMGDLITSFIRDKACDPATRLHCSIAGGRKTMSFYLGAALQLFGRTWDRLYHVLVTPEFESNPVFYYKPKKNRAIKRKGKILHTSDARIILAELPFIRLRNKLSLDGAGFRELVEEGQKEIDMAMVQPDVRVRLSEQNVTIGKQVIKFMPIHLMIYAAYLKYKLHRCRHPERPYCLDCTDCFPSLLELATKPAIEEMAKDYMVMAPSRAADLLHKYRDGLPVDIIRQAVSKIKKIIGEHIGDETLASYYAITTSHRGYAHSIHGVRVEKKKIRIER